MCAKRFSWEWASLHCARRNKVYHGKARVHALFRDHTRVCHFGPNRKYRKNEAAHSAQNKIVWYARSLQSSFTL